MACREILSETRNRTSRTLNNIGVDAGISRILAATLGASDVDDASRVDALLDQVMDPNTPVFRSLQQG